MTNDFKYFPRQAEAIKLIADGGSKFLFYGGSRSGKTFLLTSVVATRAIKAPKSRHLIGRLHNIDVRQSIMQDTFVKMMALRFPNIRYTLNKSDQYATFSNGSEIWFAGYDDAERAEKVLGKEFCTIYGNEVSQISYRTQEMIRTRLAQVAYDNKGQPLRLLELNDLNPSSKRHWTYTEWHLKQKPSGEVIRNAESYRWMQINPSDNPILPQEYLDSLQGLSESERIRFLDGDYQDEIAGAFYSKYITAARAEGRIGAVPRDNLQPIRVFCDIGGTSSKSDAFVLIPTQRVGLTKRVIDYYEAVGQDFATHVSWLRANKYDDCIIVLPHDGHKHDNVYKVTPKSFFEQAGFKTEVMPNAGAGAAMIRIEAGRNSFNSWYFDAEKASGLIDALAHYHEKRDDVRGIGLGVNHDWSSHGADAWGAACVWHEQNPTAIKTAKKITRNLNTSWMGA